MGSTAASYGYGPGTTDSRTGAAYIDSYDAPISATTAGFGSYSLSRSRTGTGSRSATGLTGSPGPRITESTAYSPTAEPTASPLAPSP